MVRSMVRYREPWRSSPHSRGDGPLHDALLTGDVAFSPLAWGWSAGLVGEGPSRSVLPTRVGMVRCRRGRRRWRPGSPHSRGDGPNELTMIELEEQFSPPAWGWSAAPGGLPDQWLVLPTRVGMVRYHARLRAFQRGSPHPRGVGPRSGAWRVPRATFSPPAWGEPRLVGGWFDPWAITPTSRSAMESAAMPARRFAPNQACLF